jgi:ABC-2 type transport system ATP-binding protein
VNDAVSVRGVFKRFGTVNALAGVDLAIVPGSTFGLVGPNGAGKTTLFSILSGFLHPSSGSVSVLGFPVDDRAHLRGQISVLPQDAAFRKGVPVGQQLTQLARLQGLEPAIIPGEVQRVLELTDMQDARQQPPDTLSHGMRKRIAISQAFLGDPKLVILDEPIAGLDPAQARRIRLLIQADAGKRTFVISSHVMADIETLCSHVAIIKAGKIVAQPSVAELTRREGVVVFTLEAAPSDELVRAVSELPFVSRAEPKPVERKLQISVRPEKNLDQACAELLQVLASRQVTFLGLHKGTSLEDAILKMT